MKKCELIGTNTTPKKGAGTLTFTELRSTNPIPTYQEGLKVLEEILDAGQQINPAWEVTDFKEEPSPKGGSPVISVRFRAP